MSLRVRANEAGPRTFELGPSLRARDHRRRDVEADGGALRAEHPGNGERRAPGAAAYVEHALRAPCCDRCHDQVLERLEQPIERLLGLDPAMPAAAVPDGALVQVRLPCRLHAPSPRVALA
jgi:hypothetical protein